MSRKSIDCRHVIGSGNCTLIISGSENEVLDAAIIHAIVSHGHEDPYSLRQQLRAILLDVPESKVAIA